MNNSSQPLDVKPQGQAVPSRRSLLRGIGSGMVLSMGGS